MVDFFTALNDTDYYIDDDTGEFIITSPVIQTDGIFNIEIPINISSNCNTIIKCKRIDVQSEIISFSSLIFEAPLVIQKSQNVTIKNCTMRNANTETGFLLTLYECENCLLSHINFQNPNNKNGVKILNSIVTADNLAFANFKCPNIFCQNQSFLTLKDSKFNNSESNGIVAKDQSSIEIFNSTFSELSYTSIYSENSHCLIKECSFEKHKEKAVLIYQSNDFTIEKCHFTDFENSEAIRICENSCGSIIDCTFEHFSTNMIYIKEKSDLLIKNNVFTDFGYPAIFVTEKSVASIQNNILKNSLHNAIAIRGAHYIEIENTKIEDVEECAISVSDTNSCLIQNNEIFNCKNVSIESYNGSDIIVKNNKIKNSGQYAFYVYMKGQIKAENNEIENVNGAMVKLAENGRGEFINNKIIKCQKLNDCEDSSSLFFFSKNGDFANVTNDKSRVNSSIVYHELNKSDNLICLNCHKNKRDCYFDYCSHCVYCKDCAENLIKDSKSCPLCRFPVGSAINGITVDDEKLCIICYDKKVDTILMPCGHIVTCSECLENWLKTKNECPVCRQEISYFKKIYNELN